MRSENVIKMGDEKYKLDYHWMHTSKHPKKNSIRYYNYLGSSLLWVKDWANNMSFKCMNIHKPISLFGTWAFSTVTDDDVISFPFHFTLLEISPSAKIHTYIHGKLIWVKKRLGVVVGNKKLRSYETIQWTNGGGRCIGAFLSSF